MPKKSTYILVPRELVKSKAFLELRGISVQVLMLFLYRRKFEKVGRKGKEKWVQTNNGEIVFPYEEARKKFGITKPRFARSLDQLIEKGFLNINHIGGGMKRDCSTYFISERWRDYGKPEFKLATRAKDTRGLGFSSKNWEERTGRSRNLKTGNKNETQTSNTGITKEENLLDP